MGRGWMKGLGIELCSTMDVNAVLSIQDVIAEYRSIFDDELGTFKGVAAKISLWDNAKPRFFKPRPVPFAMLDHVNDELLRMECTGVLRPVKTSEWAALMGFQGHSEPISVPEENAIPRVEDLFAKFSGGEKFTTLDLKDAYLQVPLPEESTKLVIISAPRGVKRKAKDAFAQTALPVREEQVQFRDMPMEEAGGGAGIAFGNYFSTGMPFMLQNLSLKTAKVLYALTDPCEADSEA
ncbi:uncharacterized protein K02A2.6-like [Rhipicephalus sanguineus]|uniref:uncharacterized protein K02A2.6-like n=1 Tax=Rhipicephalus sanguineus TaxID=34632 RepID=UPI001895A4FE|nr:uncharacterized protein K02A2.6-like [Rhipicephalus sanguineus]